MTIETKFDIGQEVYYLADNKVVSSQITSISIEVTSMDGQPKIKYHYPAYKNSSGNLFATKQELLDSL